MNSYILVLSLLTCSSEVVNPLIISQHPVTKDVCEFTKEHPIIRGSYLRMEYFPGKEGTPILMCLPIELPYETNN